MSGPTMDDLKEMIRRAGGTVADAACFEDDVFAYAFSVETERAAWGASKFCAHFNKETGWVTPPVELGGPYQV
jgi:hypothetical protein